jgi:hypothetical protein
MRAFSPSACNRPERAVGTWSRAHPWARGWYVAATGMLCRQFAEPWFAWLESGSRCARVACVTVRCIHPVDALLRACADDMALWLGPTWQL